MSNYNRYTKEFKLETIKLLESKISSVTDLVIPPFITVAKSRIHASSFFLSPSID